MRIIQLFAVRMRKRCAQYIHMRMRERYAYYICYVDVATMQLTTGIRPRHQLSKANTEMSPTEKFTVYAFSRYTI